MATGPRLNREPLDLEAQIQERVAVCRKQLAPGRTEDTDRVWLWDTLQETKQERDRLRQRVEDLDTRLESIIDVIGGVDYEGFPTSRLNYLQRLRILLEKEARIRDLEAERDAAFDEGVEEAIKKCCSACRDGQRVSRDGWHSTTGATTYGVFRCPANSIRALKRGHDSA